MRRPTLHLIRIVPAVILLAACGSTAGTRPTTTEAGGSVSSTGLTNVWLPDAIETTPTLDVGFNPDRLWFWRILAIDDGFVVLQSDDNGNGFVTATDSTGQRWRTTVEATASLEVTSDLALVATGDHLLGLSLEDGTTVVDEPLSDGGLLPIADGIATIGRDETSVSIGRFDAASVRIDVLATFDMVDDLLVTDRGVLVLADGGVTLVDLTSDTLIRWPVALQPVRDPQWITPDGLAVVDDLLVGLDSTGRLVAVDATGETVAVLTNTGDDVTDVWGAGDELIVTAGADGLSVMNISGPDATVVDRMDGPGTLGPTAMIDGTGYVTWDVDGRGSVLSVTADGFTELVAFPHQTESDVDGEDALPEQVTFVDAAVYVAEQVSTPDDHEQRLTAYTLDGSTMWQVSAPLRAGLSAQWEVESGLLALRVGYALIPGAVVVYR